MKNLILAAIAVLVFVYPNYGQFTTVNYDLERNWFNEGQALPAEEAMVIKAVVPEHIAFVEFTILSDKQHEELYKTVWQRSNNNELTMLMPYKLSASQQYDFKWDMYAPVSKSAQQQLEAQIVTTLDTYIEVNLSGDKQIKLLKSNKKIMQDLNEIVSNALLRYRSSMPNGDFTFSEVVRLKLQQLEKTNLDANFVKKDTLRDRKTVRTATRTSLVEGLKTQLHTELSQLMQIDFLILSNSLSVDDYMTEAKEKSLAVNLGYGGVYLSGEWDNFNYGASPYVGLAFPLANSVLGTKFLRNTSVTIGAFLNNFEDKNGQEITGLIVNRPVYLGLDHKLFEFIRVNAGATFLEGSNNTDIDGVNLSQRSVMVRPYVGLSARIDLSVKMGK